MLNSWFACKDDDEANDTPSSVPINTNTAGRPNESLKIPHTTPTGFISPHDAILAQMRGQPHAEPVDDDGLSRGEVPTSRKEEQTDISDTTHSTPQDPTTEKERVVYDPFEGTPIGFLMIPPFDPTIASPSSSGGGRKLEQWEHLSRVLDLQNELAGMHFEMECVGIGDGKGKAAGKGRGRGKGKRAANWERSRGDLVKERKPQRQATTDTIGVDVREEDEEGVDAAGNEENVVKKDREERFSTMADQFEGRKEAVQAIMNKLDHLSKALTQFHTLQAPDFEISKTGSKQNSTIPDVTLRPIQSKPTPYESATLPDSGISTNTKDGHRLQPVPSSTSSLHGSTPQVTVPTLLSRSTKGNTLGEPIYVNEMESGRQMHVTDSPESMKGSVVLP